MWDLEVEGSAAGGGGGGIARRQRPPSHSESLAPGPTVHLKSAASVRLRRLGRWPGPSRRALGRRARALEVECHESSSHRVRVTGTQAGTGAAPGPGPARARGHRSRRRQMPPTRHRALDAARLSASLTRRAAILVS